MSKIGKRPITIPPGVDIHIDGRALSVSGPKGKLAWLLPPSVHLAKVEESLRVRVDRPKLKTDRALWGLAQSLISNMVRGVVTPYERKLEIQGIGYKAAMSPKGLTLEIGFSHAVDFPLPPGVECAVEKNVITLRAVDKALVGQVAASIRRLRPPEPYKGKGIRLVGEVVRKKAGKAAKAAGAKSA